MQKANIIEELCAKLDFKGADRFDKLAHSFGESLPVILEWKKINKLPEMQRPRAHELVRAKIEDLFNEQSHALSVTMSDFVADVPRYIQVARDGGTVLVTVNENPVIQIALQPPLNPAIAISEPKVMQTPNFPHQSSVVSKKYCNGTAEKLDHAENPDQQKDIVTRAIEMFESPSEFARRLSAVIGREVSRQNVHTWQTKKAFSGNVMKAVHKLTGLPLSDLLGESK